MTHLPPGSTDAHVDLHFRQACCGLSAHVRLGCSTISCQTPSPSGKTSTPEFWVTPDSLQSNILSSATVLCCRLLRHDLVAPLIEAAQLIQKRGGSTALLAGHKNTGRLVMAPGAASAGRPEDVGLSGYLNVALGELVADRYLGVFVKVGRCSRSHAYLACKAEFLCKQYTSLRVRGPSRHVCQTFELVAACNKGCFFRWAAEVCLHLFICLNSKLQEGSGPEGNF